MSTERMDPKEAIQAENLIPHRGRMKLIERITIPDQGRIDAETMVTDTWPLCRDGRVDSIVCIEVIAQAAAALSTARRGEGALPRLGFLVGIKEARLLASSIPVGTPLSARIEVLYRVGDYAVCRGEVSSSAELLCTAEIQVMEPDESTLSEIISGRSRNTRKERQD